MYNLFVTLYGFALAKGDEGQFAAAKAGGTLQESIDLAATCFGRTQIIAHLDKFLHFVAAATDEVYLKTACKVIQNSINDKENGNKLR